MTISAINQVNNKIGEEIFTKNISNLSELIEKGRNYLDKSNFDLAIDCFTKANNENPKEPEPYLLLGKAYNYKNDYENAAKNLNIYNSFNNNDVETITLEGECYKNLGKYELAKDAFSKAMQLEPKSDYAIRNYKQTQNYIKACYNLEAAVKEKNEQSSKLLKNAFKLAKDYLPNNFLRGMGEVSITFDKTAMMGGRANIAQYEHAKRKIAVTDEFLFSSPQVVGAYIVHELVHAKDNDPYTSIKEEQDAFELATKFWIKHSDGIKEPEMDYSLELYLKSPQTLANRVEYIYKSRDPSIKQTSPNHPPSKFKKVIENLDLSNSQPLKSHDYIA